MVATERIKRNDTNRIMVRSIKRMLHSTTTGSGCSFKWKPIKRSQRRTWSHLPLDLLQQIMESLSSPDRIRLQSVCKSWLQLPLHHGCRPVDKLPWWFVMDKHIDGSYHSNSLFCRLFDPINKEPYAIHRIIGPDIFFGNPDFVGTKGGWVFIVREITGTGRAEIFLYCPFTKQTIELPDLCHGIRDPGNLDWEDLVFLTFSSEPNSKECVIFAHYSIYNGVVITNTHRLGDKGWITNEFDADVHFLQDIAIVECYQGDFYCLSAGVDLLVYRVAHQKWYRIWLEEDLDYHCVYKYLVVSNGELLLVQLDRDDGNGDSGDDDDGGGGGGDDDDDGVENFFSIHAFDLSALNWIPKSSLQNHALFLSDQQRYSVPAFGDTKFLANKIFFRDIHGEESTACFYDLSDSKRHPCKGTEFDDFFRTKETSNVWCFWIQPSATSTKSMEKKVAKKISMLDLMLTKNHVETIRPEHIRRHLKV